MALGDSGDGRDLYAKLPDFATQRADELGKMLVPFVEFTDAYGSLVSRAVLALGAVPPSTRQDVGVRDLMADAFDFLYECRRPLLEGRAHVAFPLSRRAYETLSLLSATYQDEKLALRWDSGGQIGNSEVRKALAKLPFSEDEMALRKEYSFLSNATHPNRGMIAERFLGESNEYVLGSIGPPHLIVVLESAIRLVDLWFWLGALAGFVAKEALARSDPTFGADYMAASKDAQELKTAMVSEFNRLLEEEVTEPESS